MRSLHLTAGRLFGGLEKSLLTLARFARELSSWSPIVGLCYEGRLSQELRALGTPVHVLGKVRVRRPWTIWQARRQLKNLLVREQPDVVICHDCWPHALFAKVARAQNVPVLFFAHTLYQGQHWLERWASQTPPDLALGNSWFTLSFVDNLFPGIRREMIHQPVAPIVLEDWEGNRSTMRRALGTPQDAVVIIQHGRLERWKGYHLALDVLGRLAEVPGWVYWIAAGAQRSYERVYLEELRRQAIALGIADRVHFLGQRTDVPAVLAASDIHCQPNTRPEPFGVVFVEAMNARLPIVTTAFGGALEIVDKRSGILVPPGETEALADAFLNLIRDRELRRQLGSYGPENARRLSDPLTQLNKWYAILTEVARSGETAQSSNKSCLFVPQRTKLNSDEGPASDLAIANNNKLRVLHINPGNLYGGVETFLVTLARCRDLCPEMAPEFAVCVPGRYEDELRQTGVTVHRLGAARFSRPWTILRARAALHRLLSSRGRFDVIVCHQPWTQALFGGVVRKHGIAYVAYFHGPQDGSWPERLTRLFRPQLVIAVSRHTLGTVQPSFPKVPSEILYYPVPGQVTATAELTAEERTTIRTHLNARPEDAVILQACRIERWKGPDLVLRALGRLRDLPNWRYWLAGGVQREHERSYLDELKRLAAELNIEDRVAFLGQRTDVPVLMRAADVYCQGNRGPEGFSLAFLEASYCQLPIVTPDLGGASELIEPATGILVAPQNVDDLAQALRTLLTDAARRKAMGARAKDKVLQLYNAPRQLHQLCQMLARASGRTLKIKQSDVVTASN